ncbi:hypothetical protein [Clostridium gasigenes]|uniref:Uncharacterized protein n=1 Tax=Clostridium gasigenes TaxID=94869 RepID=A0A1H0M4S6_9CLOT|nr:hypothetical protein [Clostridium gasigenes]SDO75384.1 hypothetical protein SAMN04488529_101320 [Clostridium gasigenes]
MEKDLFELMTKMYSEMQGGFEKVTTRLDSLETEIQDVKVEVKKTNLVIENDIKPSIHALFDGYVQNTESITRVEDELKNLRISINNLNIKTLENENNIISFSRRLSNLDNQKH